MQPLVSIIMPVYNVENYISKAIESVLGQTFNNFELLIINDGTPDKSEMIAKKYAEKDTRIRILNKENGGLSDARNVGLEFSTGDYIYFLDSDDYIEKNLLEEIVGYAEKDNLDMVIFGFFADFEDETQTVRNSKLIKPFFGTYNKDNMKNCEITEDFINYIGFAWNKLYKSEKIKDNHLRFKKGLSLIEDIEFNYSFYINADKLGFLNKCLYHYIQRPRDTLGNGKYANYYELVFRNAKLRTDLLKYWEFNDSTVSKYSFLLYFRALDYTLRNVTGNKELGLKLINKEIIKIIEKEAKLGHEKKHLLTLKQKMLAALVRHKASYGIIAFYRFIFIIKKFRGAVPN